MKNKKEIFYSIASIVIAVVLTVGILVKTTLEAPFNRDINNLNSAISVGNIKKAEEYYADAAKEKFKDKLALETANISLQDISISLEEYNQAEVAFKKAQSTFNKGEETTSKEEYKEAIKDFQMIVTNAYVKKSQEDLNIATTKFLNEEFKELEPELKARHYMDAYNKLQNKGAFIQNASMTVEYLNKIKALENENNIDLYKATGIALNKVNEDEVNIQTMVGIVDNNYITYSYPTGKLNFITREQNGTINGQEGYLYLVRQAQRVNNSLNESDEYFYIFVNMDSGKTSIYDKSILETFKPTFKVTEFTEDNAVVQQYMKNFNIPSCFGALQDILRAQNVNRITHLESLFNETKFINTVPGYKELYDKPHQLFSAYGNEYYLVTPEEVYKIQDNKLIKQGKTTLGE